MPSQAMTAEQLRRQHDERWGWRRPQATAAAVDPANSVVSPRRLGAIWV